MQLRDAYLFSTLDDDQLKQVEAMCHLIKLDDGQTLFQAGDEARRFFLVKEGKMKLFRLSVEGDEKVIEVVRAGGTFAEALMFMEQPRYPVSASALGRSELWAIDDKGFLDLLRQSVDTCFRMMGDMSLRLRRMVKEIDDLTLQNATGRVAGYLCGQFRLHGQRREVELDTPKGVLASRLSVKPETFSRILQNFTRQGLINVHGGRIEIINPEAIAELAESSGVCGGSLGPTPYGAKKP